MDCLVIAGDDVDYINTTSVPTVDVVVILSVC